MEGVTEARSDRKPCDRQKLIRCKHAWHRASSTSSSALSHTSTVVQWLDRPPDQPSNCKEQVDSETFGLKIHFVSKPQNWERSLRCLCIGCYDTIAIDAGRFCKGKRNRSVSKGPFDKMTVAGVDVCSGNAQGEARSKNPEEMAMDAG